MLVTFSPAKRVKKRCQKSESKYKTPVRTGASNRPSSSPNKSRRVPHARRVETRALMPMAGSSFALSVALSASKAKLPALLVLGKAQVAQSQPVAAAFLALMAAIASVLVSKGLSAEDQQQQQQQQQQEHPTATL